MYPGHAGLPENNQGRSSHLRSVHCGSERIGIAPCIGSVRIRAGTVRAVRYFSIELQSFLRITPEQLGIS
jgi:hypothetical protein